MISIFFSSKNVDDNYIKHISENSVLKNVEIKGINNPGKYSLAEVYNKCIEEAKYDIVLLIHDDLILSKGFDKKILNHFKNNPDYGILGLAGTNIVPKSGMWWENPRHIVGRVWHQHEGKVFESRYSPIKDRIVEVAIIDGLFIALDKNKIKYGFDERLEGYHFYDLAFCLLNSKGGVKIGIIPDLKTTHKSIGAVGDEWKELKSRFTDLFEADLPYIVIPEVNVKEITVLKNFDDIVSIIIPSKNNIELLKACVNSILMFTKHEHYEILIADTGSDQPILTEIEKFIEGNTKIKMIKYDYYHFGKINNDVAKNHAQGSYLLFCNDDIEFKNDIVTKMLEIYKANKNVGTIGARLHYPDKYIQHGGISMVFSASQKRSNLTHEGLKTFHGASEDKVKGVLGNTAALLMIQKKLFSRIGGFIENNLEAFEDLILNIECLKLNKKNIYCGNLVAIHHESISRGKTAKQTNEQKDMANIVNPYLRDNLNYIKPYIKIVN